MSKNNDVKLEDLDYFWLPNGAPCFLANDSQICEKIEGLGFQIYYLLGHDSVTIVKPAGTVMGKWEAASTSSTHKSKIFKVVNNFVGRAISQVEDDLGEDLISFKEEAHYTMPGIPNVLIQKLDEFFRLVYSQHGTESIVLLTFDTTKEGSEGWGILVPEQTNNATHCKYDPDSIVDLKEDHIMIVGSVHSHPQMPAYASGTDHEDQSDFDGLHITYGWQKNIANGATQYHLELQMAGTAYTLNVADVFEEYSKTKDPDPEVVAWSEKVKKVLPPQSLVGVTTQTIHTTTLQADLTSTTVAHSPKPIIPTGTARAGGGGFRAQVIPFEYEGTITAEIDTSSYMDMICPSCGVFFDQTDFYLGSACIGCDISISSKNSNIEDIVDSVDKYNSSRGYSTLEPYHLWAMDKNLDDFLILIKPSDFSSDLMSEIKKSNSYPLVATATDDYPDDEIYLGTNGDDEPMWEKYTLCCGVSLYQATTLCYCPKTVGPDEIQDFDEAMSVKNITIYAKESICESCQFYYFPGCPSYRNAVVDYTTTHKLPEHEAISGCTSWQQYKNDEYNLSEEKEWENYGV